MIQPHFRISDRVFVIMSAVVLALTSGFLVWAYPYLPEQIPTHFGPSGLPDNFSQKSFWSVGFLPLIQFFFAGVIWWVYRHPRHGNYPGVKNIALLPEPYRGMLERLGRHLLVSVALIVHLLLAQITLGMVSVSFGIEERLNILMMIGLVVILIGTVALNSLRMHRIAQAGIADEKEKKNPSVT